MKKLLRFLDRQLRRLDYRPSPPGATRLRRFLNKCAEWGPFTLVLAGYMIFLRLLKWAILSAWNLLTQP